jgi:hypothetical protein
MTTNTPMIHEDHAMSSIEYIQKMCSQLMKYKHYSKMGEEVIFAILQKAKSLSIDPLDALGGSLYFINGKIGMSSEMMNALIRLSGHSIIKDVKSDRNVCILHGKRKDTGDTWTCTFSVDDAKKAGIYKNMFEKYQEIMIYNRCMSMLARQLFPDVIKGAGYTREELHEVVEHKASVPQKQSDTVVEIITIEQACNIIELLKKCDNNYVETLYKFLAKPEYGVECISDLPALMHARVKAGILKNIEENTMKIEKLEITQEEKEEVVDD